MALIRSARHRLAQTLLALSPDIPEGCDALAETVLSPALLDAFNRATSRDRAHQCRVAIALRRSCADDPTLLAAALLHDIGKASGGRTPSLVDRIALVAIARLYPRLLRRIERGPGRVPLSGLAVAVRHAELGADRLRQLGADPYLVWLVQNHHRDHIADDPLLALLQEADRSVP